MTLRGLSVPQRCDHSKQTPNCVVPWFHLQVARIHSFSQILIWLESNCSRTRDVPKPAIITPFSVLKFKMMGCTACNVVKSFQRCVDTVLQRLKFRFAKIFGFIMIASAIPEEHHQLFRLILQRLQDLAFTSTSPDASFGPHYQLHWTLDIYGNMG